MIVHCVPERLGGQYGAGNWKDIACIHALLRRAGVAYRVARPIDEMAELRRWCDADATDVIFHYSFYPRVMEELAACRPDVRIHVRTVNAEALQHWQRERRGRALRTANVRALLGALQRFWSDMRTRRTALTLLSISEWDDMHYWRLVPGAARIEHVPYHSPWPELRPAVRGRTWGERQRAIVCLAGDRHSIGRDLIARFGQVASAWRRATSGRPWHFVVSPGAVPGCSANEDPALERLAVLREPWDLLCGVRAVAVLTPLGFGMKTTVVDALAAGCHVLVHPRLVARLPVAVAAACIELDPEASAARVDLLDRLDVPPFVDGVRVNDELRERGASVLRRVFGRAQRAGARHVSHVESPGA